VVIQSRSNSAPQEPGLPNSKARLAEAREMASQIPIIRPLPQKVVHSFGLIF
jgi:hypothetical protein